MATQADVRRIARRQPGTEEARTGFAFSVMNKGKAKGFVWVWMERMTPKAPRVANAGVVAIRVPNVAQRDLMIATDPRKFFTEPHYNGFPAVLVRLAEVTAADLSALIPDAWRCVAPASEFAAESAAKKMPRKKSAGKSAKERL
ncbi:MAG TPA: hypothetical protein VGM82_10405 [Gemmatimonadaceae bacterium]|jgi:hypothetical protein